jgi:hypothetical protein
MESDDPAERARFMSALSELSIAEYGAVGNATGSGDTAQICVPFHVTVAERETVDAPPPPAASSSGNSTGVIVAGVAAAAALLLFAATVFFCGNLDLDAAQVKEPKSLRPSQMAFASQKPTNNPTDSRARYFTLKPYLG